MATIYRCDKCSREYRSHEKHRIRRVTVEGGEHYMSIISDLCEGCVRLLEIWLRPDVTEAPE